MKLLTSTLLILAAPLSFAEWTLSPDSSVKFLSTKNTNITEVHEFTQVSGSVSDQGSAKIAIDLSSVETGIEIRNERMQSMLFNVSVLCDSDRLSQPARHNDAGAKKWRDSNVGITADT